MLAASIDEGMNLINFSVAVIRDAKALVVPLLRFLLSHDTAWPYAEFQPRENG